MMDFAGWERVRALKIAGCVFVLLGLVSIFSFPIVHAQDGEPIMAETAADVELMGVVQMPEGYLEGFRVAFSPQDDYFAVADLEDILVYDLEDIYDALDGENLVEVEPLLLLRGHLDVVEDVAFSPDGSQVISGSDDRSVRVWDAETGEEQETLQGHENWVDAVMFAADGTLIYSGSVDGTIRVWNEQFGEEIDLYERKGGPVLDIDISPDGYTLAAGHRTGDLFLWDLSSGRFLDVLLAHDEPVRGVAFHPSGGIIATGSDDRTIRLWDLATLEQLGELNGHNRPIQGIAFSPDGSLLASASGYFSGDNTVRLWDAETGEQLAVLELPPSSVLFNIAFNADGTVLAAGTADLPPGSADMVATFRFWSVGGA